MWKFAEGEATVGDLILSAPWGPYVDVGSFLVVDIGGLTAEGFGWDAYADPGGVPLW